MTTQPEHHSERHGRSDEAYRRFVSIVQAKQRARDVERIADRLPPLRSSKSSPASAPSSRRVNSMQIRAQIRKDQAFIARKAQQRKERKNNAQQVT